MTQVWIELPKPKNSADATDIAEKANRMMKRLGNVGGYRWHWSEHERRWCWGDNMGYVVLNDNGNWFNLDYLGRDERQPNSDEALTAE